MNPLDHCFQQLRARGRKAFVAFLTAGDPDLPATVAAARELVRAGADVLEIGFPYSDPIADGPVIQASYTRALAKGVRVDDIFRCARELGAVGVPLVGMVSYAIVHRRSPEAFLTQAQEAGFSGAIVPDRPSRRRTALLWAARLCAAWNRQRIVLSPRSSQRSALLLSHWPRR